MLIIGLVGLVFYLSTTSLGHRVLGRVFQMAQRNNTGERDQRQGAAPPNPPAGWLGQVQSFILGFLASILPAADDVGRNDGNLQGINNEGVAQDVFRGQN